MYCLVSGYRLKTPKKSKVHEMDAAKTCVQENIYKANFEGCITKLCKNQLSEDFIKTFPTYFFMNFFTTFFKQTLSKR